MVFSPPVLLLSVCCSLQIGLLLYPFHACRALLFFCSGLIIFMGASSEFHLVVHICSAKCWKASKPKTPWLFQITGFGESPWRSLQGRPGGSGAVGPGKGQHTYALIGLKKALELYPSDFGKLLKILSKGS